ncbi:MAG: peptidoglycan D,D-transpeptidase FtsI family protein [Francisellaceae bacterium]
MTKGFKHGLDKKNKSVFKRHLLRFIIVAILLMTVLTVLLWRLFYLETTDKALLSKMANQESRRVISIDSPRGTIYDRNHKPLAVTTNLYRVIVDIKVLKGYPQQYQKLSSLAIAGLRLSDIDSLIKKYPNKRYYIATQFLLPEAAKALKMLHIPGIHVEQQNRSYYPEGESIASLIGFSDFNNNGQSGLELSFDNLLRAKDHKLKLITDREGQAIRYSNHPDYPNSKDLTLTIDSTIQKFAYQALAQGVHNADAIMGTAVVIDPGTGEILAAASYPSFNPNIFSDRTGANVKAGALIDTFEPGSTIKPFIIAQALSSGKYTPDSLIDTNPGYYYIGHNRIRDDANFGEISLTEILEKSSNVGVSKVALTLNRQKLYQFFTALGFGQPSPLNFPLATNGILPDLSNLGKFEFATFSFGYAMTASTVQLAHAYSIFANDGKLCPLTLTLPQAPIQCRQIIPADIAHQVLTMLNSVVSIHGTGILANIPGFEVAGKTGTSHRVANGQFLKNSYNAIFVGIAPLRNPRLVIAVWIDDPKKNHFYQFGGVSAAPIFAQIAKDSLEYLGIPYQQPLSQYKLYHKNQRWLMQVIEDN